MGRNEEFDWDAWQREFDALPEDMKEPLRQWYALQAAIVEHLGVDETEWYDEITWALHNPGDLRFIAELTRGKNTDKGDGIESNDPMEFVRRRTTGGPKLKRVPLVGGPGLRAKAGTNGLGGELLSRMSASRVGGRR